MGNVQQKGKEDALTLFQRRKLKYDFYTFFDLNNDGYLTYNDFLWAKDKICYMSGWKIDNPKYKITEALFKEIWESLELIADIDKDGKITKTEWLMMWTTYKKEIIEREKEETDFLKKLFDQHKEYHVKNDDEVSSVMPPTTTQTKKIPAQTSLPRSTAMSPMPTSTAMLPSTTQNGKSRDDDDDWDIQLDSDEEPPSILTRHPNVSDPKVVKPEVEEEKEIVNKDEEEGTSTVLELFGGDKHSYINDTRLPKWLFKYLVFRFFLLDRTGDNIIDNEEFEYVLSEFGVREKIARQAFTIFTQNNTISLDFDYFVKLFEQYYLSNDPADLGNFINGKLDFDEDSDEDDPGLLEHRAESTTSVRSMDDDIREGTTGGPMDRNRPTRKSTIKLHETNKLNDVYKDFKRRCCSIC